MQDCRMADVRHGEWLSSKETQHIRGTAALRMLLAIAVSTAVAGLTYTRLFFGIDLTDEAFYTAVPYRFILGARPMVDETLLVQQTSGFLLYGPLWLYNSFF